MSLQQFIENLSNQNYLTRNSFAIHCDCIAKHGYQVLNVDNERLRVTSFQQLSDLFPEIQEDIKRDIANKYGL